MRNGNLCWKMFLMSQPLATAKASRAPPNAKSDDEKQNDNWCPGGIQRIAL